jgi:hypothetical protein
MKTGEHKNQIWNRIHVPVVVTLVYRYRLKGWQLDFVCDLAERTRGSRAQVIEYVLQKGRENYREQPDQFLEGFRRYVDGRERKVAGAE